MWQGPNAAGWYWDDQTGQTSQTRPAGMGDPLADLNAAIASGDPQKVAAYAATVDRLRNPEAFEKIMQMQAQQAQATPGQATGWQGQSTISPEAAAAGSQNWQQLNSQSQEYEDSQHKYDYLDNLGPLMALGGFGGMIGAAAGGLGAVGAAEGGAGAGGAELAAGVGGIDSGSLSQIMGNGGYMSPAASAAGGSALDTANMWGDPGFDLTGLTGPTSPLEVGTGLQAGVGAGGAMSTALTGAPGAEGSWWQTMAEKLGLNAAGSAVSGNGGTGGLADWARILGTAGAGLYGAKVANDQTQAYKDMAAKYAEYGAPYRQRLADLYANPSSFLGSQEVQKPVQMGSDIMARSLSMQGNPTGSGNALQQLQSYSADQLFGRLGQEKDRLGGFGGLSGYNAAAPSAANSAIQSMAAAPNTLAAAASDIFNPKPTYAQSMQQFKTLFGG